MSRTGQAARVRGRSALVTFVLAIGAPLPAGSAGTHWCAQPAKPLCLDVGLRTDSDFESCRSEINRFVSASHLYAQCLSEASNDAMKEALMAMEQLSCYARREAYCF
jgi:hypothetical protein